ncbi:MAG: carbamoyl phosphate synthase small subunit [Ruminococcus sp.]|nr:carbamoyl phosphate synthase small subunit [Ruminococcus sp.]
MSLFKRGEKAYLLLADGTIFEGLHFGVKGTAIGEVVFTTGMTAYQETLTDPSYYGQLVTQTFPLIGNYGVNQADNESTQSYISGYIVREWCDTPSNFRMEGDIDFFLKEQNIVGIYNIDTRRLTRIIREVGVMNGVITTEDVYAKKEELLTQVKRYVIQNAISTVTGKELRTYSNHNPRYRVALYDFGYKRNIRKELVKRSCEVIVLPAEISAKELEKLYPNGIMLSNGPGDPTENQRIIRNIRDIVKLDIPIFGICLGHQLMALSQGCRIEKLKYGHRGANQPVIDLNSHRTYVTSQNHGYAVVGDSLDPNIGCVSHINANDQTCEGIRYHNINAFTVQFHPEAHGGPLDTTYLFDKFVAVMEKEKEKLCH